MNVLSIGNSFSSNAHLLLPQIVKADGADDEFMLCNLKIDGCSLERHWNNMKSEEEAYQYEVFLPGETQMSVADELAFFEPIEDEDWDVITLQQVSQLSGDADTFTPYLEELIAFVRLSNPKAKIFFHQTWAYAGYTKHPGFDAYSRNTDNMAVAINEACRKAAIFADFDEFIPSGQAFAYARQTSAKDDLNCPDGFHASREGCYLAGACFYEKIFGRDIRENKYVLPDHPVEYTKLLAECAHLACEEFRK